MDPHLKNGNGKNGGNGHYISLDPAAVKESGALRRWGKPVAIVVCLYFLFKFCQVDVLHAFTSRSQLSGTKLDMALMGFCMSPLPGNLMRNAYTVEGKPRGTFAETGDMKESDYSKGSIYALLYAMYKDAGTVKSERGIEYEFTFNTWGVEPEPGERAYFRDDDPQLYGKAAYAGLASLPAIAEYRKERGGKAYPLNILEIGSGTGAGANLISSKILKNSRYTALDMQAAGTATCKRRHSYSPNTKTADGTGRSGNVTCVHAPMGVTIGSPVINEYGQRMADASVDIVIVCETHIAADTIGPEEEAIFAEIWRVLKPGGLFVWGNALPTRLWLVSPAHLAVHGFEQVSSKNVTAAAVRARDLDAPRVNAFINSLGDKYKAFRWFGKESTCAKAGELLVKNFYRHPGTALYLTMVSGFDSYMRVAFRKVGRPPIWDDTDKSKAYITAEGAKLGALPGASRRLAEPPYPRL